MGFIKCLSAIPLLALAAAVTESVEQSALDSTFYGPELDKIPRTFEVELGIFQPEMPKDERSKVINVTVTYETVGQFTNGDDFPEFDRLFGCLDVEGPPFSDQVTGPFWVQSVKQNWFADTKLFAMNRVVALSEYNSGGEDGLGKCTFPSQGAKICPIVMGDSAPGSAPVDLACKDRREGIIHSTLPEGVREGDYPAKALVFLGPAWNEVQNYLDGL